MAGRNRGRAAAAAEDLEDVEGDDDEELEGEEEEDGGADAYAKLEKRLAERFETAVAERKKRMEESFDKFVEGLRARHQRQLDTFALTKAGGAIQAQNPKAVEDALERQIKAEEDRLAKMRASLQQVRQSQAA